MNRHTVAMNRRTIVFGWVAAAVLALPHDVSAQGAPATATGEVQFPIASQLGMVPPPGMTLSTTFQGFEDSTNSTFIRLVAMPENAYAEIEKTMTSQALKKQNITVERRESFKLGSGKGLLVVARQDTGTEKLRKWLLIAPVGGLTAMAALEMPLDAKKDLYPEAAIRASFATLSTRTEIPADEQLALVPFKVGDLAGFKVGGVVPGRAVQLVDGGPDATETSDRAYLVIGIAPGTPPSPNDRDSFARLAFAAPPNLKDVRILSSEGMRIGGQPGHEMRMTGKDAKSGAEIEAVQWLRFGSGAYLRIVGFAPKDGWTEAFTRFRAVRDGMSPR
jgi:hypothetical protein